MKHDKKIEEQKAASKKMGYPTHVEHKMPAGLRKLMSAKKKKK